MNGLSNVTQMDFQTGKQTSLQHQLPHGSLSATGHPMPVGRIKFHQSMVMFLVVRSVAAVLSLVVSYGHHLLWGW